VQFICHDDTLLLKHLVFFFKMLHLIGYRTILDRKVALDPFWVPPFRRAFLLLRCERLSSLRLLALAKKVTIQLSIPAPVVLNSLVRFVSTSDPTLSGRKCQPELVLLPVPLKFNVLILILHVVLHLLCKETIFEDQQDDQLDNYLNLFILTVLKEFLNLHQVSCLFVSLSF
jgi:hypothetical protein